MIPFLEVVLRTTIQCLNSCCDICIGKRTNNSKEDGGEKEKGEGTALQVQVGTGAKVILS